jgi:3-oxoacyl-[acyl-carrier protein] reductase
LNVRSILPSRAVVSGGEEAAMDLQLEDKVVVIGGGSRGIGRATARAMAREGCRLVVAARTPGPLDALAAEVRELGAQVVTVAVDLTANGGPETLVERALARFGRIDVLVNNSGGSSGGSFADNQVAEFETGFGRNFWPALRASKAALPALEAAGGVVVNVSSIWGREAGGLVSYNVAKAALVSLTKAMGRELAPRGVRCVGVAPGSVLHPGGSWERRLKADPEGIGAWMRSEIPAGRFGTAEELGDVITFLASPRASWVNGTTVVVDGGQSRSF